MTGPSDDGQAGATVTDADMANAASLVSWTRNTYDADASTRVVAAALAAERAKARAHTSPLPAEARGDGPCMDCGTLDTPVWFTDNVLWNRVVGGEGAMDDPGGMLCPICFIGRAERSGLRPTAWHLTAEFPWRWAETAKEGQQ